MATVQELYKQLGREVEAGNGHRVVLLHGGCCISKWSGLVTNISHWNKEKYPEPFLMLRESGEWS